MFVDLKGRGIVGTGWEHNEETSDTQGTIEEDDEHEELGFDSSLEGTPVKMRMEEGMGED